MPLRCCLESAINEIQVLETRIRLLENQCGFMFKTLSETLHGNVDSYVISIIVDFGRAIKWPIGTYTKEDFILGDIND